MEESKTNPNNRKNVILDLIDDRERNSAWHSNKNPDIKLPMRTCARARTRTVSTIGPLRMQLDIRKTSCSAWQRSAT